MPKRSRLPFMPMGVMTGRYFPVHGMNASRVAKALRQRYKDMRFTVQKPLLPMIPVKVMAEYKDHRDITQLRADEITRTILKLKEDSDGK